MARTARGAAAAPRGFERGAARRAAPKRWAPLPSALRYALGCGLTALACTTTGSTRGGAATEAAPGQAPVERAAPATAVAPLVTASAGNAAAAARTGAAPSATSAARADSEEAAPATAPPPRAAVMRWLVVPVDQTDVEDLALLPDGGVLALGENAFGITSLDDMFLLRLDRAGNTVWQKFGTGRQVRKIAVGAGRAFVATEFSGRVLLDPVAVVGPGGIDAFVGALDLDGNMAWGRVFSTADMDRAAALAPTTDGGVVFAHGAFVAPRSGPYAFSIAGGEDTVLTRWSATGELRWLTAFAWPGYDEPASVITGGDGHLLVAGTRWTRASAWASALADGPCHGWLSRVGPDGQIEWVRDLGEASGHLGVRQLVAGHNGELVVRGSFRGHNVIGGAVLEAKRDTPFVAVLDPSGAVRAARAYPAGSCLAVDDAGRILLSSPEGVLLADPRAEPATAPTWLVRWEPETVEYLPGCVAAGTHHLYLSGTARQGATLAGQPLPAPRTRRFRTLPAMSVGFVAKLDY